MRAGWICMVWALAASAAHAVAGPDTTFTYQGRLTAQGDDANGTYDMTFRLYDVLNGGNLVGGPIVKNDVAVSGGLFSVDLDYGAGALEEGARWLQITVEGVTLSPRQAVTPAPFAIQTRGIFVAQNQNVGIGTTMPTEKLHVVGSVRTDSGISTGGAVAVNHDSATEMLDVDGNALVRDRFLVGDPFNSPFLIWADPNAGFFGVNRTQPVTNFEVFGIYRDTTSFGGMYAETSSPIGDPFYGYSAGGDADAYHYFHGDDDTWRLVTPAGEVLRVEATGQVTFSDMGTRAPFAYGLVRSDGVLLRGSTTVQSVVYQGSGRYDITLAGGYNADTHITVVTPSYDNNGDGFGDNAIVTFMTSGSKLRVQTKTDPNNDGTYGFAACDFHFVVYRP